MSRLISTFFKNLILVASNFDYFEGQANWRSLILAVSQFNVLLRLLSSPIGATFKGKSMLPMGSIFFPLTVGVVSFKLKHTLPFES